MALTIQEEIRISELENTTIRLTQLMKGSGSKNQLNRLLVMAQEDIKKLTDILAPMEDKTNTILALARKLQ